MTRLILLATAVTTPFVGIVPAVICFLQKDKNAS